MTPEQKQLKKKIKKIDRLINQYYIKVNKIVKQKLKIYKKIYG